MFDIRDIILNKCLNLKEYPTCMDCEVIDHEFFYCPVLDKKENLNILEELTKERVEDK